MPDEPNGATPAAVAAVVSSAPSAEDPPAEAKTFTQAEVDAIVRKRAERVASDKYGDYDDLKAKAQRLEEIEHANASDLEKAVKKARDEGYGEAQSAANTRLISAEARALAAEAKFIKPHLAVKVLDLSGVKVDQDGNVDTAKIKSLLADLAADAPELIVSTERPRPKPDDAQGQPRAPGVSDADVSPGMERLRVAYASKTPN